MGTGDRLIVDSERGWHSSDEFICPGCVDDKYLQRIVADASADDHACSFCDATPTAEFDVFMEALMVGIDNRFEQADDAGMPWEHGYVFTTHEYWDIAEKFGWVAAPEHEAEVVEAVRACLEEKTYASRWWAQLEPQEAYSSAWRGFCEQILHRTRFVFWARRDDNVGQEEITVAEVLGHIGNLLVKFDCIATLPAGTLTFRARGHERREDSQGWGAADLGTNSPERTTNPSRMSPAGIPLFYGADDTDTALTEVGRADPSEFFTVGQFRTTAPITVLDLTAIPSVPSIFDPELGRWQGELRFLDDLVQELRKPVDVARSNLDYVPTQVFCEYILRVFDEADIRGLAWRSAAAVGGSRCLALDVPRSDCVDAADATAGRPQLVLTEGSVTVHQRRTDEFRHL